MEVYSAQEQRLMLRMACSSIEFGLIHHAMMVIHAVAMAEYPKTLQCSRACFVTLQLNHQLRGCIGSLLAHQPLIQDICHNAYAAAFQDPRFPSLTQSEYAMGLDVDISILSQPQPMSFHSETELLQQIRPGIDGLILSENKGIYRGTFLPSVWESLPNPKDFLNHLKQKAGLPPHYWSDSIQCERYTTTLVTGRCGGK